MKDAKPPRWMRWAFLIWAIIVLGVYVRQLLENAAEMGIGLPW